MAGNQLWWAENPNGHIESEHASMADALDAAQDIADLWGEACGVSCSGSDLWIEVSPE